MEPKPRDESRGTGPGARTHERTKALPVAADRPDCLARGERAFQKPSERNHGRVSRSAQLYGFLGYGGARRGDGRAAFRVWSAHGSGSLKKIMMPSPANRT